jgi:hypothetical protein
MMPIMQYGRVVMYVRPLLRLSSWLAMREKRTFPRRNTVWFSRRCSVGIGVGIGGGLLLDDRAFYGWTSGSFKGQLLT